ncbi:Type 1 glutamine amidotransferase-like domain-containing protein [uncultured Croceitalea sp.]|uniref:cyanophycinase n=1 Tax=uncultured Croceitalea sp. TaxID=1798908 RepID=UPI00330609AC
MKNLKSIIAATTLLASLSISAQVNDSVISSQFDEGYLMLIGGRISQEHADFIKRFTTSDSPLIVIPTAYSDDNIKRDTTFTRLRNRFKKIGIDTIQVLHTRSREEANRDSFIRPILASNAVFFMGGNTANIVGVYKNTKTHTALENLLERGGLVSGVSAGSGSQASYFTGDSKLNLGFEFLKNVIVMNHFLKRNKPFDNIDFFKENRSYLGLGIDDNTAVIFHKGVGEIFGSSYVAIYDGTNYVRSNDEIIPLPNTSERFYFLQNGDRYDINNREVLSNKRLTPIEIPLEEYLGSYKSITNKYGIELSKQNNVLMLTNSWGWEPYPIYPSEKDLFFAKNRTMWFRFKRSNEGEITGIDKMKSVLQEAIINELKKI